MLVLAQSCRRHLRRLESGTAKRKDASLRKLLAHLAIQDSDAAEDGGDPDILHLLTFSKGTDEDHVLGVIRSIVGGGPEQRVAATKELERLACEAAVEALELGRLTVPKGHHGDQAVKGWIDDMLVLYTAMTGEKPGTSVGAPLRKNEGLPGGPLIRFCRQQGSRLEFNSRLALGGAGFIRCSPEIRYKTESDLDISTAAPRPRISGPPCRTPKKHARMTDAAMQPSLRWCASWQGRPRGRALAG